MQMSSVAYEPIKREFKKRQNTMSIIQGRDLLLSGTNVLLLSPIFSQYKLRVMPLSTGQKHLSPLPQLLTTMTALLRNVTTFLVFYRHILAGLGLGLALLNHSFLSRVGLL